VSQIAALIGLNFDEPNALGRLQILGGTPMSAADLLIKPEECVMLLVDFQAGLGFGV